MVNQHAKHLLQQIALIQNWVNSTIYGPLTAARRPHKGLVKTTFPTVACQIFANANHISGKDSTSSINFDQDKTSRQNQQSTNLGNIMLCYNCLKFRYNFLFKMVLFFSVRLTNYSKCVLVLSVFILNILGLFALPVE